MAETITALAILVPALVGAWVSLRKELRQVHTIVNSRYDRLERRLNEVIDERDNARDERDAAHDELDR